MTTESQFSAWLCKNLKSRGAFVQRIESSTGNGIPDVWVLFNNRSIWLELKFNTLHIRPEQFVWSKKAYEASERSFHAPNGDRLKLKEKQVYVIIGHTDETFSIADPLRAVPKTKSYVLNRPSMKKYKNSEFESFMEDLFQLSPYQ